MSRLDRQNIISQIEEFYKNVRNGYDAKFENNDLLNKNDNDKLLGFALRYQYLRKKMSENVDVNNEIEIEKNNVICRMLDDIRKAAQIHHIEEKLSIYMTNMKCVPLYEILSKHDKHLFQYLDEMYFIQNIYKTLKVDNELFQLLDPKLMLFNYKKNDVLLELILLCEEDMDETERNKLEYYMKEFNRLFPREFCLDVCEINRSYID